MSRNKAALLHTNIKKELAKDKWLDKSSPLSYLKIAKDMIVSNRKYRLMPDEYVGLDFSSLTDERRKQIITRFERNQIVDTFNLSNNMDQLESKVQFLRNFKPYLNRNFLFLQEVPYEDFENFYKQHSGFVAKVSTSGQGKDVQIVTEVDDLFATYHSLKSSGVDVIEEIAEAHPDLKIINPIGLPSIRIITFLDDKGEVHFVSSALNMSIDDPVVNTNRGGVKALLNPQNGEAVTGAIGKSGEIHEIHPISKVSIKGFRVPEWEEVKTMLTKAAKEIPTVRYIGWDVSVSDKGPLLIEANAKSPGINGIQLKGYKEADVAHSNFEVVRNSLAKMKCSGNEDKA